MLGQASDRLDEVVPLLAGLLGVPTGERYPALTMTPEVQKRQTMQALVDHLAALAAQQPVLALYEDAHWIDPSTLQLLGLVIERIERLPVLLVITFRPEFQPAWTGQAHVTSLTMSRLSRREGADLVARVTGDKPLPAEIIEQIVAKTDGVPLFVEELTKTVLESGLLQDAGDHYQLAGPLTALAIPSTLHDSLLARLDRLAPVKEVAQIGAALGREFSHNLLAAVAGRPEPELLSALDQLVAAELVFRRGVAPEVTYSFKHALVQDVAYGTLLRSRRRQLHASPRSWRSTSRKRRRTSRKCWRILPPHNEVGTSGTQRRHDQHRGENRISAAHILTSPIGRAASMFLLQVPGNVRVIVGQ